MDKITLIKEIQSFGKIVDLRDPDHLPGAVDLETRARMVTAASAFNGNAALKTDVANKFRAKVDVIKSRVGFNGEPNEFITLSFPALKTKKKMELSAKIMHDSMFNGYVLWIAPVKKRSEAAFIPDLDTARRVAELIKKDWEDSTGVSLHPVEISVPLDSASRDTYHSGITVRVGSPSVKVPTKKYINGVKKILQTIKNQF